MAEQSAFIEAINLWKSYGSVHVLKGLSLSVDRGETIVILGRSGVGKSVLLRLLLGLEVPDQGEIKIGGQMLPKEFREALPVQKYRTSMLFQGAALFDSMSVEENVAFYLRQHAPRTSEEQIRKQVDEALEMVGLQGVNQKFPHELSGGMKKRAGLARAVISKPDILLYDEPTTGLDPITAMQINTLIHTIQSHLHTTSIVVTHDLVSAFYVANRLAFHSDGRIIYTGTKEAFKTADVPEIKEFLQDSILNHNHNFLGSA